MHACMFKHLVHAMGILLSLSRNASVIVMLSEARAPVQIIYVGGGVILSTEIGVGGLLICGVLGQLSLGIILDGIGVAGRESVPITWGMVLGALLVFAGAATFAFSSALQVKRAGTPTHGASGKQGYAEFDDEDAGQQKSAEEGKREDGAGSA